MEAITVNHSKRRPLAQAWCVVSNGHSTYGKSKKEAVERHRDVIKTYEMTNGIFTCCAKERSKAKA